MKNPIKTIQAWWADRKATKDAHALLNSYPHYRNVQNVLALLRLHNLGIIKPEQVKALEMVLGHDWRTRGVCVLVDRYCNGMSYSLTAIFSQWPLFSGRDAYPVPHPTIDNPSKAFHDSHDLWAGEYGATRIALLEHVLTHAQEAGRVYRNHLTQGATQ